MLVSHEKKFIYIKTIKTAGTSVEMALQPCCMPKGGVVTEWTDCSETKTGIVGARGPNAHSQLWWNHMPASVIRARLPEDIWNNYCKICNIRNPWDKTVSRFHMAFRDIKNEDESTVIKHFQNWLNATDSLGKDTGLYFIDRKPVADFYIRYEHLTEDLKQLSLRLGLVLGDLPHAKADMRGSSRIPYTAYYDTPTQKIVAEHYALEIAHFGWTFH
jgi:hypothetical protein